MDDSNQKLSHKQNFTDILRDDIVNYAEENSLSVANSAARVLLEWLGYDIEDLNFLDNKDSGIDAWSITERGIDIYQVKTHDLTNQGQINTDSFDNSGVNDLTRAKTLLCSYDLDNNVSKQVKTLLDRWSYLLRNVKEQEVQTSPLVTLNLILLGDGLTDDSKAEFDRFSKVNEQMVSIDDIEVKFDTVLYDLDSIIMLQWKEDNRDWKDITGKKKTSIKLKTIKDAGFITDNKNAIFYCCAYNLVQAYDALGYQLFEPNVRAEIKRSKVNESIRESIRHSRSRKDFRFLNNGVTITCESFEAPKGNNGSDFTVHYPGIVNGLQTVVALNTAYKELSKADKEDFKNNTSVLVRVLTKHAVNDITDVVRATNNQNPMKPRNLVSNSSEQIGFSKLFAKQLNWFYEAKEGAWNAFEKDSKRWRPSLNKTVKDFKNKNNKVRKIDNLELAQTWLSFFGCSSTAAEERQYLFEKNHYELIFNKRVKKHGYHYDYSAKSASSSENSENCSPDVNLMLISYLSFNFAKYIVPSPKENRKQCYGRLGDEINKKLDIDDYTKLSTIELDGKMFEKDNDFAIYSILRYMPFLFTDFVGFILFEALGENVYNNGKKIISTSSYNLLKNELGYELIKNAIDNDAFEENDLLIILWLIFYDKIEDWINTDWKQSYRGADRKQRFVLSKETRNKLYNDISSMDKFMKKKPLTKIWAIGVNEGQGLFEFIHQIIVK